jgi:hypothetical protein
MTVEQLIQSALGSTFVNGIWPGRARDQCPAPYATYIYFGPTNNYLVGRSADQNKRVQIDVWAKTAGAAEALADSVEVVMDSNSLYASPTTFTSTQISRELMEPDEATDLRRVMLEFSIWYRP